MRQTSSSFELVARASGNPGSAALQSGNVPNLLRFVADQQMSQWSANETEDAMKRAIVVTAGIAGNCAERARRSRQEAPAGREWGRVPQDRGHEGQCHELRLGDCQRPDPLAADGRTPKMLPPYPRQRGLGRGEPKFDPRHTLDGAPKGASSSSKRRALTQLPLEELPTGCIRVLEMRGRRRDYGERPVAIDTGERFAAALSLLCRRRIEESDVARESEAESGSNIAVQPRVLLPSLRTG